MSTGIVLGELVRLLFPERYPYFTAYFEEEKNALQGASCTNEMRQAIRFKLKLVRNALYIKENTTRELVHDLFEKLVDDFYDWHKPYSWHELKAVLFYFILFREAKNPEAVLTVMKEDGYGKVLRKYLRERNKYEFG